VLGLPLATDSLAQIRGMGDSGTVLELEDAPFAVALLFGAALPRLARYTRHAGQLPKADDLPAPSRLPGVGAFCRSQCDLTSRRSTSRFPFVIRWWASSRCIPGLERAAFDPARTTHTGSCSHRRPVRPLANPSALPGRAARSAAAGAHRAAATAR